MDKEAKTGGSALSGNSLLAFLMVAAGALVLHETPLQGTRPAANEPKIEQRFAEQDIDARLWQDPFGAVERGREELAKKTQSPAQVAENKRHEVTTLRKTIAAKVKDEVIEVDILAVMVAGGPYAEQVEARRRTRYAVLAGLNASHYAPIDTEHVGYFLPVNNATPPHELPQAVPYEWFEPEPGRSESACRPPACQQRQVLVLWLDSAAFSQRPFQRITKLFDQLLPTQGKSLALRWRVLGPPSSGGLRAMVGGIL